MKLSPTVKFLIYQLISVPVLIYIVLQGSYYDQLFTVNIRDIEIENK